MIPDVPHEDTHEPFRERRCNVCHRPHASEFEATAVAPVNRLCFVCHEKMKADIAASPERHLPAEDGECTMCHNPHGSALDFDLADRPTRLCLFCHQSVVKSDRRKGHIRMEKGDCLSCHRPHYGKRKFLLVAKEPALCTKCHIEDNDRMLSAHRQPISTIDRCTSCHESHVTDRAGMLKPITHEPFGHGKCEECHE
jgi:predicted CXXCH cytochrome family protein